MLRDQVNAEFPQRNKSSDGTIGDAAHASRSSDHNAWIKDGETGVVSGMDISHDPKSGCDSYVLAQKLLDSRDDRIKYIISNKRIASGSDGPSPWAWRRYTGSNPHDHHCHISVKSDKAHYDNERMWKFDATKPKHAAQPDYPAPPVKPVQAVPPTVRRGDHNETVKLLQSKLGFVKEDVDGYFGAKTEAAVKTLQIGYRLLADGVCGPQSWKVILGKEGLKS
jgi:peptidoglycan hydrolase-like protein with peptidoglycan-binding domain